MMAAQEQQTYNNRPTPRSTVPTYTECREPTPADGTRKSGPPFEAVCKYRRVDLTEIPHSSTECYPRVVEGTMGLWTEQVGLLSPARILPGYNSKPVAEAEAISLDRRPMNRMAEAAEAMAKHTVQACPAW
jgi:hypothetical protein